MLKAFFSSFSERLAAVYRAQAAGRDVSPADQAQQDIEEIILSRGRASRGQGYGLDALARRQVELCAMHKAREWFELKGYAVEDCSSIRPYDLHVQKGNETIKVEVKGTTSDFADAILMTRNEVELHRREAGSTALALVSSIQLSKENEVWDAKGGVIEVHIGWEIDSWDVEPTVFRVSR